MTTENTGRKSLLDRTVEFIARVEPREQRPVITAMLLLFFIFTGNGVVRPVRETVGTILGTEATQNLWFFTALFGVLAVPCYGWLVAHFRRAVILPAIFGFTALVFALYAWIFRLYPENLILGRIFYVFFSVINLLSISIFWSFLLEVFDSAQTKRLFAVIFVGGSAGAFLGPIYTRGLVAAIGHPGVLLTGACLYVVALVLLWNLITSPHTSNASHAPAGMAASARGIGGNPFAGFMLVMRSPYLLGIMLFVIGISAITTFLYFEQLEQVEKQFKDLTRRTEIFANLDAIVQGLTALTQLLLTGRIATRFGLTALLVTVPCVMVFGLSWYAFSGTFMVLAIAMVVRRWGEYAFIRPGREMLFGIVDKESKYKAKNLIDVGSYRSADFVFAQGKKFLESIGVTGAKEALLVAGIAAAWAVNGWWLGRRHEKEKQAA